MINGLSCVLPVWVRGVGMGCKGWCG